MSKILLLSDDKNIITPLGSINYRVTSRDPLPIKVQKHFINNENETILSDKLPIQESLDIEWLILFKEATVEIEDVIIFCQKNNCNLLILKEEIVINEQCNFILIHNYYLTVASKIFETVRSRLK